ncbi:MAG: META domain-containing protein [Anaerolineales bacterium]
MRRYRWALGAAMVAVGATIALAVLLQGRSSGDLAGTRWSLVALNGRAPLPASGPITLEFEIGGRAGGNSGCNSYGGTYVARGGSLTFGEMVSTLRACVDPSLNDQEAAFLRALAAVTAYEMSEDQLILRDAAGATALVFAPA